MHSYLQGGFVRVFSKNPLHPRAFYFLNPPSRGFGNYVVNINGGCRAMSSSIVCCFCCNEFQDSVALYETGQSAVILLATSKIAEMAALLGWLISGNSLANTKGFSDG